MSDFIDRTSAARDAAAAAHSAERVADHQRSAAHHAQAAARNAVDYRGTTFSYGASTGISVANASHARHVQQMIIALARRRARLRNRVSEQSGDDNIDEPGGVEGIDYDIEAASGEHHDAGHHGPGHRRPASRRRPHGRHRHGVHGTHDGEGDDAETESESEDATDHHESRAGRHGDHAHERRVHRHEGRHEGHREGGGQGGGTHDEPTRASAASDDRPHMAAGPRLVLRVLAGAAIDVDVAGTGSLQRLAACLPHDALRDHRLHEAHFEQIWSLRQRALIDVQVSFEAGVHEIELDWNETQRCHGALKPLEGAAIRDRLVEAARRHGVPPPGMPDVRTASMNLLLFLVLLSAGSPATAAQRRVAADTRVAQIRLHRLARAASRDTP